MDPVRRLADGTVDHADPVVDALLESMRLCEGLGGQQKLACLAEVAVAALDLDWYELWLKLVAPGYYTSDFAVHHVDAWNWLLGHDPGRSPRPLVMCLHRGGGKTAMLQFFLLWVAAKQSRRYCLYVGATQSGSNDKIGGVGEMLQGPVFRAAHPGVAAQYMSGGGAKKDWRSSRIRTGSGFTLDAMGMNEAIRGARVDEDRPGFIVLDDVEDVTDTPYMTAKKMTLLSHSIIPAGSDDVVIVFIQNKIHDDSIMAGIIDGSSDFLGNRKLIGPIPQIWGFEYETRVPDDDDDRRFVITGGTPSWDGLTIEQSEQQLNKETPAAFIMERQHELAIPEDGMFPKNSWRYVGEENTPKTARNIVRAWDLAATDSESADYTVGVLMMLVQNQMPLVLEVERFRGEVSEVHDRVAATAVSDKSKWGIGYRVVIEKQPAAAGKAWGETWKRLLRDFKLDFMAPQGTKEYRADSFAVRQQKLEAILIKAPWNAAYVNELALFTTPLSRNDDQVDASAMAYTRLLQLQGRKSSAQTPASQSVPRRGVNPHP